MSILLISGSVGCGKTTVSKTLAKKLGYIFVPLNEIAKNFKLNDVKYLQTFDFDLDKLLEKVEKDIQIWRDKGQDVILEGHFSHFINPELVDILFIITRDLQELKKEYIKRGYNEQKVKDNLEVESFNLCFYEAIEEGYKEEKQVFTIENNEDIVDVVDKMKRKLNKLNFGKKLK